jgi:NAD(P)-dependent dehydrogenase (short-subunit alcohol dehydrogenase family)
LAELEIEKARHDVEAHLLLPLQVARYAAKKIRPGGTLLFMSGTGGRRTAPGLALISALTAALPAMTKNLALELAPIRVNLIAAGFVDSSSRYAIPNPSWGLVGILLRPRANRGWVNDPENGG